LGSACFLRPEWIWILVAFLAQTASARSPEPWVVYEAADGPGKGKHIVLISGDEEYRSEETLPQLAKILAKRHGFKCTVLFAIDSKDGTINPNQKDNIPGLENLATADLMVIFTRMRDLPDKSSLMSIQGARSSRCGPRHTRSTSRKVRPTPGTRGKARNGPAVLAGRCSARPGSPITATMAARARAASW